MKTTLNFLSLLLLGILFFACSKLKVGPEGPMVEPVGSGHYFIENQSNVPLTAVFPIPVYNFSKDKFEDIDSTISIAGYGRTLLFKDEGIFGVNPTPKQSFKEIRFYKTVAGNNSLAFEINPIKNEDWVQVIKSRDKYGYGLTEYSFTIEQADLK
jgi:hypothetical protein